MEDERKKTVKKSITRFLGILMAVSAIAGLLSGCNTTSSTASQTSAPTSAAAAPTASAPARTLTVEVFDRGKPGLPPVDNNFWTKWINSNFGAKFNATVKFIPLPRSQETDELNVWMAANQAPDICFTYDQGVIYNYVAQGGLTQLDDLVSQYGQNLTKYLGMDLLKYGKFNGKTFAIPGKMTVLMGQGSFIRKDWLDKLGLPLPKTVDDLYNDLVAFRDKNPGKVEGVVPMAYAVSIANMADAFLTDVTEATIAKYQLNQSEILWGMPGYKDCMQFMNKLYNEKLISPDFAIDKTWSQLDADVSSGKAGFYCSNWDNAYRSTPGDYINLLKTVPDAELVPVDCFANAAGKHPKEISAPNAFYIVVPKTSKNADLAVQYLDWMSQLETIMYLQNGEEGKDYTLKDGIPVFQTPSTFTDDRQQSVVGNIDILILVNGPETGDPSKNMQAVASAYPGFETLANEAAKIAMTDAYSPYYFEKPNAAYAKYGSTLYAKSLEMWAKVISCSKADFNNLYDSLVAEYMAAGGQAIIDENVKDYEEQTGKKIS
jgi:putative aldouronate transport system substrate-binding protein